MIDVVSQSTSYDNPYAQDQQDGFPHTNPAVTLPTPNDQLSDKVTTAAEATATASTSLSSLAHFSIGWIVGIAVLAALLLLVGIVAVLQRRKAHV